MTNEVCNESVVQNGTLIATFYASSAVTEPWVQKVSKASKQLVDWFYSPKTEADKYQLVNVLYIGDYNAVRDSIEKLKSNLEAACILANRPLTNFTILGTRTKPAKIVKSPYLGYGYCPICGECIEFTHDIYCEYTGVVYGADIVFCKDTGEKVDTCPCGTCTYDRSICERLMEVFE